MGPGQKFPTRAGFGQFFVARVGWGWVSHLWFGVDFGKFPLKISNFYPSNKISSGWVKKSQVKGQVGLLFTASQK